MKNEFNPKKIRNILIQFRIPFSVDTLDSIDSNEGSPYEVFIDDIPAQLRFRRIYEFKYKSAGADMSPFSKVDQDRNGILSHSEIQIIWDKRVLNKVSIPLNDLWMSSEHFVDLGIEYVNKFLNSYRDISEQFWIKKIVKRNIFNYTYRLFDEDKITNGSQTLIPQHNPVQFNGGKNFNLEEKQDETLRKMLQTNYFSFRNELISDANENYSLGNYNISLLQSVIRFENFVYSQLKNKGFSTSKLNKYKKKECDCLIGISEICKNLFQKEFNIDFGSTREFKNLQNFALTIRNKIVHGDLEYQLNQKDCFTGIDAIGCAEKYLIENIFTNLLVRWETSPICPQSFNS